MVLFDEIEKAHPDVWNTLLQVLDDGRLTDGQGRTVDFKNTVVIMTSNVGSQFLRDVDDVDDPEVKKEIDGALRAAFKPEFLNRVDDIIVFHKLGQKELRVVVEIQLERLKKLVAERGYTLELTPAALDFLVANGYDAAYGARPLKRAIQKWVQDPLATRIISGEFKPGDKIFAQLKSDRSGLEFGSVVHDKAEAGDGRAA